MDGGLRRLALGGPRLVSARGTIRLVFRTCAWPCAGVRSGRCSAAPPRSSKTGRRAPQCTAVFDGDIMRDALLGLETVEDVCVGLPTGLEEKHAEETDFCTLLFGQS